MNSDFIPGTVTAPPLGTPVIPVAPVGTNGSAVTSTAFDPPASCLMLVALDYRINAVTNAATLANNGGLSMTLISDQHHTTDPGSGVRSRQRVWAVPTGAVPPTGLTFTGDPAQTSRNTLRIIYIPGTVAVPGTSDVLGIYTSGGNFTFTFDHVPAASSIAIGFLGGTIAAATPVDPATTFTELEDTWLSSGQEQVETCYLASSVPQNVDWTNFGTLGFVSLTLVEIRQP